MNSAIVHFIKFGDAKPDRVKPMRTPCSINAHFFAIQFRGLNFCLLGIVILHTFMKYKNNPHVAVFLQSFKRAAVNLVYKGKLSSRILHETTLPWCSELLSKTRLQIPDRLHLEGLIFILDINNLLPLLLGLAVEENL